MASLCAHFFALVYGKWLTGVKLVIRWCGEERNWPPYLTISWFRMLPLTRRSQMFVSMTEINFALRTLSMTYLPSDARQKPSQACEAPPSFYVKLEAPWLSWSWSCSSTKGRRRQYRGKTVDSSRKMPPGLSPRWTSKIISKFFSWAQPLTLALLGCISSIVLRQFLHDSYFYIENVRPGQRRIYMSIDFWLFELPRDATVG